MGVLVSMALQPNIILSGSNQPSLANAIRSGFAAGEAIRNAPLMRQILEQRVQQGQNAIQAQQFNQQQAQTASIRENARNEGVFVNRLAKQLKQVPPALRPAVIAQNAEAIRAFGRDPRGILTDDQSLDVAIAATNSFADQQSPVKGLSVGGNIVNPVTGEIIFQGNEDNLDQEKLGLEERKLEERRLERLQRDQQFKAKSSELKPGVQKILDAAQTEAVESDARARQLGLLASDLQNVDIGGGTSASFNEFLKERLGAQDDVTELRRRYNAIRSSEAVQNLPPGVASDKDIELALKGFPKDNAPASQLISFLRGAEKLARYRADYNRVKSELISEQGSTRNLLKELRKRMPQISSAEPQQTVSQPNTQQQTTRQKGNFKTSSGINFTVE